MEAAQCLANGREALRCLEADSNCESEAKAHEILLKSVRLCTSVYGSLTGTRDCAS